MRAVRSTGEGVEVVDIDEPEGPGELLTMRTASICGSDLGYIAMGSRFVLGHELAGVTEDGRHVAVEAAFGCMTCVQCRRGDYNLCARIAETGLGLAVDGGMSHWFRAPAERLVDLPPGLDLADASLVEPASVAWHGLRSGNVGPDTRVAVVGGGAIGLLAVAGARAMGAPEVALEARHDAQIAAGERLGATTTDGGPYDVVVEAAGSPSALTRAVDLAAPGGCVVLIGVHTSGFEPPFLSLLLKEVRLVPAIAYGRHAHGHDMAEAAAMLAADPEVAATLVTHRFPLEEAPQAFAAAADRAAGAIKVVIDIQ
jgi:2-desacetyl-2-hydroxyethyl bacteriochlorophyllide A dehydrogenase